MSKTPDEIKLSIECCINERCVHDCIYYEKDYPDCKTALIRTMNEYSQQLESKLNQAVEDIRMLGRTGEFICPVCAHYNHREGTKGECVKCLDGDGFRWRGETV